MKAPICVNCAYHHRAAGMAGRHPVCRHAEAKFCLVTGQSTTTCERERDDKESFCGPEGLAFWPLSQIGQPGEHGFARMDLINWLAVSLIALVLSSAYLLDGPSEMDAIQATADAKNDAIESAASHPIDTGARGQKDQQTIVAAVRP